MRLNSDEWSVQEKVLRWLSRTPISTLKYVSVAEYYSLCRPYNTTYSVWTTEIALVQLFSGSHENWFRKQIYPQI